MDDKLYYPYPGQDKHENLEYGKDLIFSFCDLNDIRKPKVTEFDKHSQYFGFYQDRSRNLFVNIKKCVKPVNTPGFRWSYTGYKCDLTPAGVMAHELGHYVDELLKHPSKKIRNLVGNESHVTSYEIGNRYEIFAEAFRLFILNPDLLKKARPKRYHFFTSYCGLQPIILNNWDTVLTHAHDKLKLAAKNFVKNK